MSEQQALAVIPQPDGGTVTVYESAKDLMRRASDVAGVCREIVMRTAMELQGKKYVKVEGWQSMATAFGCSPSIREVVEEERGIRAVAELRRHDGTILATAEGYCGLDEPRWATQPLYARRGMAQTRAISRVCRSVFAFVVVLIDENLSTTPAEEIPAGGEIIDAPVTTQPKRAASAGGHACTKATLVKYGKTKGQCLCKIPDEDLAWQLTAAKKSHDANDPKWHESNTKWLETVQAEASRRAFPEATGKREAPAEKSARRAAPKAAPKQQELPADEGEELVTPLQALWRLGREHGKEPKDIVSFAMGSIGKATSYTHEDVERVRAALQAVPR